MCLYVSVLWRRRRRRSGASSGALTSSYFAQSSKSSIWRLMGGLWLEGAHRSEQKYWTFWLTGCKLSDTLTDCLVSGRPTVAWFDSHTHTHAHMHIFRNWVIPCGPQTSDRFTSKRQNILSDKEREGLENGKLIWLNKYMGWLARPIRLTEQTYWLTDRIAYSSPTSTYEMWCSEQF